MFTNWLTTNSSSKMTITNNQKINDCSMIYNSGDSDKDIVSICNRNNNNSNNHLEFMANNNMINCLSDPDVLIEIDSRCNNSGSEPGLNNIRFMAHSIILSAHSGYFRSAIRMDDRQQSLLTSSALTSATAAATIQSNPSMAMIVLHLNNVSHEQFAPLLNYMYTGYLDLNVDNIFGILLATHVLHMPRALEICREYLARTQANGYYQSPNNSSNQNINHDLLYHSHHIYNNNNNNYNNNQHQNKNGKVIRPIPIPSKLAPLTSLGFLPLNSITDSDGHQPLIHTLPSVQELTIGMGTVTPSITIEPRNIMRNVEQLSLTINSGDGNEHYDNENEEENENIDTDEDIDVDEVERQSLNGIMGTTLISIEDKTTESEEVFIDNNPETDNATLINMEKLNLRKPLEKNMEEQLLENHQQKSLPIKIMENDKNSTTKKIMNNGVRRADRNKRYKRKKLSSSSSLNGCDLQIAKAPIPVSQLIENDNATTIQSDVQKVIIDVASCDGPVRFKRILNAAYGQSSENLRCSSIHDANLQTKSLERSQKSLSLSFHQQMAKTISQHNHQQQYLQRTDESENSEETSSSIDNCSNSLKASSTTQSAALSTIHRKTNEIYVCVYCKHTFKSQYCYQKHAKRHLNPLNLPISTKNYANNTINKETDNTTLITSSERQQQRHNNNNNNVLDNAAEATAPEATTTSSRMMQCNRNKRCQYSRQSVKYNNNKNHYYRQQHHHHQQQQQQQHLGASKVVDLEKLQIPTPVAIPIPILATRDIKPLDMNVQYFPCKTCGCKFPSYYFVHKHRKLCHTDDENQQQLQQQQQHLQQISISQNNPLSKVESFLTIVTATETHTTTTTIPYSSTTTSTLESDKK